MGGKARVSLQYFNGWRARLIIYASQSEDAVFPGPPRPNSFQVQQRLIGGDIRKKSKNKKNRGRRKRRPEMPGSTQTEAKIGTLLAPLLRDDAIMAKMNEAHGLQREVNRRLRDIGMDCVRREDKLAPQGRT
jgi:hypothetical protein